MNQKILKCLITTTTRLNSDHDDLLKSLTAMKSAIDITSDTDLLALEHNILNFVAHCMLHDSRSADIQLLGMETLLIMCDRKLVTAACLTSQGILHAVSTAMEQHHTQCGIVATGISFEIVVRLA